MEKQLIDDCFYVEKKSWGTWQSHYSNGQGIITSLTEEDCIRATRFILQVKQEEMNGKKVEKNTYSGSVDYKL